MPPQSALLAGATAPDRSPLGWLILIPLAGLALLQALFAWHDVVPVFAGELADTDAYMRMVRVVDLAASGDWFDARLPRVNPPEGHVQHWTRPLDALLLAGAWALQPFLGFRSGLHVWGVLISPVFLALAIVALDWATRPILARDARLFVCLAFLMQPTIEAYTIVGRPDHHSLLLALFVVQLGLTIRLLLQPERRHALAAGAIGAVCFWVSLEALVALAVSLGVIAIYWLCGDRRMSWVSRDYLLAMTVGLALGLVIERGPNLLVIENDRLSLAHVAIFGAIAAFWALLAFAEQGTTWAERSALAGRSQPRPPFRVLSHPLAAGAIKRLGVGVLGIVVIAAGILSLFPGLLDGPLGRIDPLYARLRLQKIVEFQPLIPGAWLAAGRFAEIAQRATRIMGMALLALPFLVVMLRQARPERRAWVAVGFAVAAFLPLALHQVRFSTYAQALLVIPYAALVAWLLGRMDARLAPSLRQVARPLLIVAALFWPVAVADALPEGSIATAGRACPIDRVAPVLTRLAGGAGKTVLTYTDYAPALLYQTPLRVLSIPNHRPQPGFAATYRVLTAVDARAARAEAARHGVDWILLCPSAAEQRHFAGRPDQPPNLYRRLVDGHPPPWLRPLPLPPEFADQVRLFAVVAAPD